MRNADQRVLFIQGGGETAWDWDARLAQSLDRNLGPGFSVVYPRMPDESNPNYPAWKACMLDELDRLGDGTILVGHSMGGSMLIKMLVETNPPVSLAGIVLISAPFMREPGGWDWKEAELPANAADRIPKDVPLLLYHGEADEEVPFAHLALYAEAFPKAIARALAGRNHQLNDDLTEVADDIRKLRIMRLPHVVSRETWLAARQKLLLAEKEMTRARDALNAERRRLPMVRIDKEYAFEGAHGRATLRDVFESRRQLIVYHMMWVGCPGCSLLVDNIGHLAHLHARDTTLVVISRAPWPKLAAFWKRMGWTAPCYSSFNTDFNQDFHVSPAEPGGFERESSGISVFLRESDQVFHTYSTTDRGTDILNGTLNYLDLTPLGRQEDWEQPPGRANSPASGWWCLHDEY